ncbi:hypothetical protein ACKKBG_A27530 [Auxenochlorella protothecoides x Auxenochlorella symbiontica]
MRVRKRSRPWDAHWSQIELSSPHRGRPGLPRPQQQLPPRPPGRRPPPRHRRGLVPALRPPPNRSGCRARTCAASRPARASPPTTPRSGLLRETTPGCGTSSSCRATQAYLSGNRALAKQLSAAGREAATEMRAAHAAAATALFEGRNLGEGGRETPGCRTLDLHGLHVAEALERVRAAVKAQRVQRGTVLRLVVGEGRHGKVPARLPAAVRQLLTEEGVRWKEPYAGLLQASF